MGRDLPEFLHGAGRWGTIGSVEEVTLVTLTEGAKVLGVHPRQLLQWASRGRLQSFRIQGRRYLYVSLSEVKAIKAMREELENASLIWPHPTAENDHLKWPHPGP